MKDEPRMSGRPPGLSLELIGWDAPGSVWLSADDSTLIYDQSELRPVSVGTARHMLNCFIELASDESTAEQVLDVAKGWGPLGLDDAVEPSSNPLNVDHERVEDWQLWARRVRAVLSFAGALHRGLDPEPEDRRVLTEWDPRMSWPVRERSPEYHDAVRAWREKSEAETRPVRERAAADRLLKQMERESPGLMQQKAEEVAQVAEAERDKIDRPGSVTDEERAAWKKAVFKGNDGQVDAGLPVVAHDAVPQWAVPSWADSRQLAFCVNRLLSQGRVVPELQWSERGRDSDAPSFALWTAGFFGAIALATAAAVTERKTPMFCAECKYRFVRPPGRRYCDECGSQRAKWRRADAKRRARRRKSRT